jgi:hypothetical protein
MRRTSQSEPRRWPHLTRLVTGVVLACAARCARRMSDDDRHRFLAATLPKDRPHPTSTRPLLRPVGEPLL